MARVFCVLAILCMGVFGCSVSVHAEGAIATGNDGRGGHWYGISSEHSTQARAVDQAMHICRSRGGNCRLAVTFRNRCGAIAYGNILGVANGLDLGQGKSQQEAITQAMGRCAGRGARCELKAVQCDHFDEGAMAEQARQADDRRRMVAQQEKWAEERAAQEARERLLTAKREIRLAEQDLHNARTEAEIARQEVVSAREQAAAIIDRANNEANFIRAIRRVLDFSVPIHYPILISAIGILNLIRLEAVRSLPFGIRIGLAIAMPIFLGVIYQIFGLSDEITLLQAGLVQVPVLGGWIGIEIYYSRTA